MIDPITTLIKLNKLTLRLDDVQCVIDHARITASTNQAAQLALDRKQTEVDEKRALIEITKLDIASRN